VLRGEGGNWRDGEYRTEHRFLSRVFLDYFCLCAQETQTLRPAFACSLVQSALIFDLGVRSIEPASKKFVAVLLPQMLFSRHIKCRFFPK
jgi:hypothetical protein